MQRRWISHLYRTIFVFHVWNHTWFHFRSIFGEQGQWSVAWNWYWGRNHELPFVCRTYGTSLRAIHLWYYEFILTLSIYCCSSGRNSKTFKPKKNIPEGTHQYDLMKHAAATLGSGNLRLAVSLPDGEDLNEWVAVNSRLNNIVVINKWHQMWLWLILNRIWCHCQVK